ncbi:IPT/TIG domain protein [mine drainage metagenome]|uniref:IPT/TIG domain protein n=1 Tax=mine drainage metagenome TaxID=410659 RepID=A0A1J5SYE6_9ZZZZ
MHTKPLSLARKFVVGLFAVFALLALAGCNDVTLTNLTPSTLPENPSEIYTITLRAKRFAGAVQEKSINAVLVVNGQTYPMHKSRLGDGLYECDYQLPPGHDKMVYYFLVNYKALEGGTLRDLQTYTGLQTTTIATRYVLSLEVTRGPVGSRIAVLGRGFTPQDVVMIGNVPARTVFESSTSLSFFVPPVPAGRNYNVTVSNSAGSSPVGTFRVDPASVTVSPSSLSLSSGQSQPLTFTLSYPAADGGQLLDVTTDVPESVIMREVVVPAGQTSVTVNVQGGRPGSGNLYLKGFGDGTIKIPVTVQ